MALLPLYLPIVVQKVVLCTSNSLLAFTDVLGLSVTIGDAGIQAASGAALGQCLPERTTADVSTIRSAGALDAIGMVAGELLETVQQSAGNLVLSGISTSGDAVLSYIGGVISGMQDVTQTVDMAHCKMPDFYMSDVYRCACGDTAVVVPAPLRSESVAQSALWCA
eukprot:3299427-Rhodomonas_salina.1